MRKPTKKQLNILLENAYKIISDMNRLPESNKESEDWVKEYNNIVKPNVVQ